MRNVSIVGSGSWALALSKVLKNQKIIVKCRKLSDDNKKFGNNEIFFTENFSELKSSEIIFLAIPSQALRQNLRLLRRKTQDRKFIFVICSKGVEKKSNKLMSEVIEDIFPKNKIVILSGPNFSSELISKTPSASVLSSSKDNVSYKISELLLQKNFRVYFNNDIIGTQLGGAMKNIIAIACGFIKGKNLGENAKAATVTRGMSEIVELGLKMGAKRQTFYGLSGIGDLILTCSSLKSRNTRLGFYLAKGGEISEFKKNNLLEGVNSCESICNLGKIHNVELPLCHSVKKIIEGVNADKIISDLLSRPLQFES